MGKYLIYQLHPFSSIAWTITFLITILLVNNVFFLVIFLIFLLGIVMSLKTFKQWSKMLPFIFSFGLVLTLVNLFVNHSGEQIFWYGTAVMLLKLISMLTVFFIYQRVIDIDSTFSYLSQFFPQWILILSLTTRSIPNITMDFIRIKKVMTIRGVNWKTSKRKLAKQYLLLLKALVLSTLEGAWETAEAIHARGYGQSKRTIYRKNGWRKRDTISTLILLNYYLLVIIEWGLQV